MNIKIGIVGASIAGLACAAALKKLGVDITVFEKSSRVIYKNGAGIMMPLDLLNALNAHNLLGSSFQYFHLNEFTTFIAGKYGSQKLIGTTRYHDSMALHWGNLHTALEERFDKDCCRYNHTVTNVINHDKYAELVFNDRNTYKFDYVIFADGYNSLGRAKLFPHLKLEFAPYIAWRGLVPVRQVDSINTLGYHYDKEYYRYLYEKGHLLLFPVPDPDIKNNDSYMINWVLYENLTYQLSEPLAINLTTHNFPPGSIPDIYKKYLYDLVDEHLPAFPRNLIRATDCPFTQTIADIMLPKYVIKRVCLLGDSSTLLRPHVGSNATKALQDAVMLAECVQQALANKEQTLDNALERWNQLQNSKAQHLFPLARGLGELLVTNVPNLETLNKDIMDQLWNNTIDQYKWYGNINSKLS